MKTTKHTSKYFYGNKISDYGLENKRLDYKTLYNAVGGVMVNDITKLFYSSLNGEYIEPELINAYIDNTEQIEEIQEKIDILLDQYKEEENDIKAAELMADIDNLEEQIKELEKQQEESCCPEIYQYFIISSWAADIIAEFTNDPIYYIEVLDMYIWGITHWGTSWDYVLTDVKLEIEE